MKCARCQEMHHGLDGLAPYPKDATGFARTYFDWLCKECQEKRRLTESQQSYHETEEEWL